MSEMALWLQTKNLVVSWGLVCYESFVEQPDITGTYYYMTGGT